MRFLALCVLFSILSTTWAQDAIFDPSQRVTSNADLYAQDTAGGDATTPTKKIRERKTDVVPNPFAQPQRGGMMGMEMMMGMGEEEMEMDMEMGGMSGMSSGPSPEQVFREGLQRAIIALRKAKSDDTREMLRGHIREAFEKRYETMIAARRKDIARLKQSVANLEAEMQRRAVAKDRVVQLQLQSVQLAAEGILEPNELLPRAGKAPVTRGTNPFGSSSPNDDPFAP